MKIPNMTIKITVEGLSPAALDTLAEMLNKRALEIILSDDQPRDAQRDAQRDHMAAALQDADKRGFDFGAATAQAMSTVDHLLEDAIGALDEDRLLVVFDRLTAARAELRAFWVALAEEMNLPVSHFVDDEEEAPAPAPELVKAEEAERAGEPGLAAAWRARTSPSLSTPPDDDAP